MVNDDVGVVDRSYGRAKGDGLLWEFIQADINDPRLQYFGQSPAAEHHSRCWTTQIVAVLLRVGEERTLLHRELPWQAKSAQSVEQTVLDCRWIGCCWRPALSAIMTGL